VVDLLSVQRRLALLADHRARLAALSRLDLSEYLQRAYEARYLVQVCAQLCIDLANHIIADAGWAAARDQRDAFARLVEQGLLEAPLAARLQSLVGLRNRLVHVYDDIDDLLVRDALAEGLPDLDAFARMVAGLA